MYMQRLLPASELDRHAQAFMLLSLAVGIVGGKW